MDKWLKVLDDYHYAPDAGDFGELVCRIAHMESLEEHRALREWLSELQQLVEMSRLVESWEAEGDGYGLKDGAMPDVALADPDWKFLQICTESPSIIESALVISGAALLRARDPGRVVGFYPAHTLDYTIRLLHSPPARQIPYSTLFLAELERLDAGLLEAIRSEFAGVQPGFGAEVEWPTAKQCADIAPLAERLDELTDIPLVRTRETVKAYAARRHRKFKQDDEHRLMRMGNCFRDISVVCRLLAQPCGWLRLLLYSKLCLLGALRHYAQGHRPGEIQQNCDAAVVCRRRLTEVADAVVWELAPLIRSTTMEPFDKGHNIDYLFSDSARKTSPAMRKRLQRGRERLLFNCKWMNRNAIIEPNSVLDGRDDGLLEDLALVRAHYW
ncbi:MAG: hypothetical protein HUU55_22235 [Myxococcales bacterium]|nr:hypothetical protein [Myxococcales bacterium]